MDRTQALRAHPSDLPTAPFCWLQPSGHPCWRLVPSACGWMGLPLLLEASIGRAAVEVWKGAPAPAAAVLEAWYQGWRCFPHQTETSELRENHACWWGQTDRGLDVRQTNLPAARPPVGGRSGAPAPRQLVQQNSERRNTSCSAALTCQYAPVQPARRTVFSPPRFHDKDLT